MKPLRTDKKISWWFSKPVILIEIILIILILKGVFGVYLKYSRAAESRDNIEAEYNRVEERYETLGFKVQYLETEFAQEEAIRERFDVALPGESVIKLVDKEIEIIEKKEKEEVGFWRGLIGIFGF